MGGRGFGTVPKTSRECWTDRRRRPRRRRSLGKMDDLHGEEILIEDIVCRLGLQAADGVLYAEL